MGGSKSYSEISRKMSVCLIMLPGRSLFTTLFKEARRGLLPSGDGVDTTIIGDECHPSSERYPGLAFARSLVVATE